MEGLLEELLRELVTGSKVSLQVAIMALSVLALHEILGAYIKAAWFWVFPLEGHTAELERLRTELEAERAEHASTRDVAEKAILRANRAEAIVLEMRRNAAESRAA